MEPKVVVVTGANAGIGLSLADRLLDEYPGVQLCLACRNKDRAETARRKLLQRHPGAEVSIVLVDVSSVKSVLKGAAEIRQKFKHIDLLYLNAGIMKVSSINIKKVLTIFHDFRREGAEILSTGKGVLNHINNVTDEGLQEVFATNIFGHYVLVRELQDCCLGPPQSQIVWTSSQNAEAGVFNFQDIQHKHGKEPYSSSKHATDILSVALNSRFNEKGVYSTVTCPGLVMSNIVFAILPAWFWWIVMPFLYFMRFFVPNLSCSAYNGAEALIWVSKQRLASLNPRIKYLSHCSVFGQRFIAEEKLHVSDDNADSVYNELEKLYQGFKHQYEQASIIHTDQSFSGCLHNEQTKEQIANGWH